MIIPDLCCIGRHPSHGLILLTAAALGISACAGEEPDASSAELHAASSEVAPEDETNAAPASELAPAGESPLPAEQAVDEAVDGVVTACGDVGPPPLIARWVEWDGHAEKDGLVPLEVGDAMLHVELQSNLLAAVDVTGEWDLEVGGVRKTAAFPALQLPAGGKAVLVVDFADAWPAGAKLRAPASLIARFTMESGDEYGTEDEQWQASPQEGHVLAPVLRVTPDGDAVRVISQDALSKADCLAGVSTTSLALQYPELDDDALAAVASGEIVEVTEWVPELVEDAAQQKEGN